MLLDVTITSPTETTSPASAHRYKISIILVPMFLSHNQWQPFSCSENPMLTVHRSSQSWRLLMLLILYYLLVHLWTTLSSHSSTKRFLQLSVSATSRAIVHKFLSTPRVPPTKLFLLVLIYLFPLHRYVLNIFSAAWYLIFFILKIERNLVWYVVIMFTGSLITMKMNTKQPSILHLILHLTRLLRPPLIRLHKIQIIIHILIIPMIPKTGSPYPWTFHVLLPRLPFLSLLGRRITVVQWYIL